MKNTTVKQGKTTRGALLGATKAITEIATNTHLFYYSVVEVFSNLSSISLNYSRNNCEIVPSCLTKKYFWFGRFYNFHELVLTDIIQIL